MARSGAVSVVGPCPVVLYKRWTLRPGVTAEVVGEFVLERIIPMYRQLSGDVDLVLEAVSGEPTVLAIQRWRTEDALREAFEGPAFVAWWADYELVLIDWDRLVELDDEWQTVTLVSSL